jgi:hypothetical protein
MNGAAAIDVLGALAKLPEGNVPVKNVRFVSGTPLEKLAGLYWKGDATSSSVPLMSVSYENPTWRG